MSEEEAFAPSSTAEKQKIYYNICVHMLEVSLRSIKSITEKE